MSAAHTVVRLAGQQSGRLWGTVADLSSSTHLARLSPRLQRGSRATERTKNRPGSAEPRRAGLTGSLCDGGKTANADAEESHANPLHGNALQRRALHGNALHGNALQRRALRGNAKHATAWQVDGQRRTCGRRCSGSDCAPGIRGNPDRTRGPRGRHGTGAGRLRSRSPPRRSAGSCGELRLQGGWDQATGRQTNFQATPPERLRFGPIQDSATLTRRIVAPTAFENLTLERLASARSPGIPRGKAQRLVLWRGTTGGDRTAATTGKRRSNQEQSQ